MRARAKTRGRGTRLIQSYTDKSKLLSALQDLELEAHRLQLTVTAHAINNAKNALGWEMAGNIVLAGKSSRRMK